ncbi:hypothetical protein YC2023_117289 [Brassica napus]
MRVPIARQGSKREPLCDEGEKSDMELSGSHWAMGVYEKGDEELRESHFVTGVYEKGDEELREPLGSEGI